MREYGAPGGLWLCYELDLDRGEYVVKNEGGDEVAAFEYEVDAKFFCIDNTNPLEHD